MTTPRLIAYYLPQYHPIPENDAWWGEGFTEWTNVVKAKPLFRGHYQPHLPADLGFYDLRVPEVRERQAELARTAGIEGFCYWHYWFAGKQLLERPFKEVLASGKPDFPFCLAWANQSWTGIWHGNPEKLLIEQTYPGPDDHIAHFNVLLPAFLDPRYLRVESKPIFLVFQPSDLDAAWVNLWQSLARESCLEGLYLVGIVKNEQEARRVHALGFDACTISRTNGRATQRLGARDTIKRLFGERNARYVYQKILTQPFDVFDYRKATQFPDLPQELPLDFFPCVMPGWDNTPRSGLNGQVFQRSSPELFQQHLRQAVDRVQKYAPERQIVIIKSWNEWAEGNYLEPDLKFGTDFLAAVTQVLSAQD